MSELKCPFCGEPSPSDILRVRRWRWLSWHIKENHAAEAADSDSKGKLKMSMPKPLKLQFEVYKPSELAAGLRGFTDTVHVVIESGDPGGEPGEFEQDLRQFLSEWFDANVTLFSVE